MPLRTKNHFECCIRVFFCVWSLICIFSFFFVSLSKGKQTKPVHCVEEICPFCEHSNDSWILPHPNEPFQMNWIILAEYQILRHFAQIYDNLQNTLLPFLPSRFIQSRFFFHSFCFVSRKSLWLNRRCFKRVIYGNLLLHRRKSHAKTHTHINKRNQ